MKKILSLIVLAVIAVSCYDDADLRNLISNTKQDVVDLAERIKDLEDWQETVNSQVKTLQDLVGKAEDGKVITNVQETAQGYVITFSDESVITVKHGAVGADGTDGIDGQTPAIGVKADADGKYYWTINGEWLYAGDAKVKAQGADGVTPKLQIKDGEWTVSYDNGTTWEGLGVYVGTGDGSDSVIVGDECLFKEVVPSDTKVTFVFKDETSFEIPLVQECTNLLLTFSVKNFIAVLPGTTEKLDFTVSGAEGAVSIEYIASDSWVVELQMTAAAAGTFSITAPEVFVAGKLVVFATDATGKVTMKSIRLEESDPNLIFKDNFSWSTGATLLNTTSGEKRWDSYTGTDRPEWTTTTYTGAHDVTAYEAAGGVEGGADPADFLIPALWMRQGHVRMNYAKRSSNLVTPKLSKIEGTADLSVSFRACRFRNKTDDSGVDGWHEIHVSCFGAGTVSQETFSIDNFNNMKDSEAAWNTLDNSIYTFTVTGATAETQIEFHFGPRRAETDNLAADDTTTPAAGGNANRRMGFDDVVVMLAQ